MRRPHASPLRRHLGFTLVELMIVMAILATLFALGVPKYRSAVGAAQTTVAIKDIRDLMALIDLHQTRFGELPLALADLGEGPLVDPWGNPYQYLNFAAAGVAASGNGGGNGGGGGNGNGGGGNGGNGGGNGGGNAGGLGQVRKDRFLVPLNSTYDLYSMGPDGKSVAPLTAQASRDDIVRANDGEFVGVAEEY